MENPYRKEALRFDETGHLLNELACIKCAYILRGLTLSSVCPECGTAVGRSAKGDFLKFADPAWVMKLAMGINWIVGAMIARFVLGCLSRSIGQNMGGGVTSPFLLHLVMGMVSLIGFWMLTTPDPGARESSAINARTLTRYSTLLGFVLSILALFLIFGAVGSPSQGRGNNALAVTAGVMMLASILFNIASFFFSGFFAIGIARRIPSKSLGKQIVYIMIGMVIVPLVAVGLITFFPIGNLGSNPAGLVLVLVTVLASIVLLVWTLVLIVVFRNKLNKAAADARRTWASGYSTPVDVAQWEQQALEALAETASTDAESTTTEPAIPGAATAATEFSADSPDEHPDEPEGESQIDMSQWPDNQ
jgi:hypothetical protein